MSSHAGDCTDPVSILIAVTIELLDRQPQAYVNAATNVRLRLTIKRKTARSRPIRVCRSDRKVPSTVSATDIKLSSKPTRWRFELVQNPAKCTTRDLQPWDMAFRSNGMEMKNSSILLQRTPTGVGYKTDDGRRREESSGRKNERPSMTTRTNFSPIQRPGLCHL